jgi:hypothetical protein
MSEKGISFPNGVNIVTFRTDKGNLLQFDYNISVEEIFKSMTNTVYLSIICDSSGSMSHHWHHLREAFCQLIEFLSQNVKYLPTGVEIRLQVTLFATEHVSIFPIDGSSGYGVVTQNTGNEVKSRFPVSPNGLTYMHKCFTHVKHKIWSQVPINAVSCKILMTDGKPCDAKPQYIHRNFPYTHDENCIYSIEITKRDFPQEFDTIIAIGTDYDGPFLKVLSNNGQIEAACTTHDIMDYLRIPIFERLGAGYPVECCLCITAREIPTSVSLTWEATTKTDEYRLNLGDMKIGFVSSSVYFPSDNNKIVFTWRDIHGNHSIEFENRILDDNSGGSRLAILNAKQYCKELSTQNLYEKDDDERANLFNTIKKYENSANIEIARTDLPLILIEEWKEIIRMYNSLCKMITERSYDMMTATLTSTPLTRTRSTVVYRSMTNITPDSRTNSYADRSILYSCPCCFESGGINIVSVGCDGNHCVCSKCMVIITSQGGKCPICRGKIDMKKVKAFTLPDDPKKKCRSIGCKNRVHTCNSPCGHVTYCKTCADLNIGNQCPFVNSDKTVCCVPIIKTVYIRLNYEESSTPSGAPPTDVLPTVATKAKHKMLQLLSNIMPSANRLNASNQNIEQDMSMS